MRTAIDASPVTAIARVPGHTDQGLIAAVRGGDDAAFAKLYERYHRRIAAYVYGMVKDHGRAEDITQEVFLSALRRMRATDRPIAFKPWLYEIAKNACIDQFRRSRRGEEVSYNAEGGLAAEDYGRLVTTGPSPDAAVDQKLSLDHLCGAFSGLSETHHEILVMRELEGLSYREIGERLGMSRPAVESTLFRARRRLTEEYEELVSGQRCVRVQAIIAAAATGALGARDRRRMAAHVSHCQPCRRHALVAGVSRELLQPARAVRAKIAAFVPLPAFLRRRWEDAGAGAASSHGAAAAQWSAQIASFGDPAVAQWAKAVAAAAAIAVAGIGAGVATHGELSASHHAAGASRAASHPVAVRSSRPAPTRTPAARVHRATAPARAPAARVRNAAKVVTRRPSSADTSSRAPQRGAGSAPASDRPSVTKALEPVRPVPATTRPLRPHGALVHKTLTSAAAAVDGLLHPGSSTPRNPAPTVSQVTQAASGAADAVTGIVTGG